jgi:hypothetical protein
MISDVAHRLAMHTLNVGDVDRAAWAVRQGLLACPGSEVLHRDRMRIADASGDRAQLDGVIAELRADDDGWIAPETEQLYEQLRAAADRRSRAAAPPDDEREVS